MLLRYAKVSSNLHELNLCEFHLHFSAWCPLKGHTYLDKPAAESRFVAGLFKYVWPFRGHQALKR